MRQWSHDHPELDNNWFESSNYLVCLSVPTEEDLDELLHKASQLSLCTSVFREPDLDDALTAIVMEPCDISRQLVSNLPLALK